MKKSLILVAMLVFATTLFAENESVSCESELGQCTYTLSDESFSLECVCRDGSASGEDAANADGNLNFTLPTEEECRAELENVCKGAGFRCENEAGECILEQNGDYECWCYGFDYPRSGQKTFENGVCDSTLVEECGTELATPLRKKAVLTLKTARQMLQILKLRPTVHLKKTLLTAKTKKKANPTAVRCCSFKSFFFPHFSYHNSFICRNGG